MKTFWDWFEKAFTLAAAGLLIVLAWQRFHVPARPDPIQAVSAYLGPEVLTHTLGALH